LFDLFEVSPIISFVSYFSFWTFDISVVAILWDHLIFSLWLCLALLIFCIFRSISLLIPLDEFLKPQFNTSHSFALS
ncbi:unnamed protein product, partial [Brassica oleracea var. botrytis]